MTFQGRQVWITAAVVFLLVSQCYNSYFRGSKCSCTVFLDVDGWLGRPWKLEVKPVSTASFSSLPHASGTTAGRTSAARENIETWKCSPLISRNRKGQSHGLQPRARALRGRRGGNFIYSEGNSVLIPKSEIVISLFLGGRNTKIKRASLGQPNIEGLYPCRYS